MRRDGHAALPPRPWVQMCGRLAPPERFFHAMADPASPPCWPDLPEHLWLRVFKCLEPCER